MAAMEISEADMADADILGLSQPVKTKKSMIIKDFVADLENWSPGRTNILFASIRTQLLRWCLFL